MHDQLTNLLLGLENLLWGYLGVPTVLLLGIILTAQSNFAQLRNLPAAVRTFLSCFRRSDPNQPGIHPLKAFFACIGGSVGVGNVVGVTTAIQIGGPGALFWLWVTAIAGAVVKYSEVYLGIKHRVSNQQGGYHGGPMYFLQQAWNKLWVAQLVCVLLCIYGVEIFQFSVVTKSVSTNFGWNIYLVVGALTVLVIFAGLGGVRRVGTIASALIPVFVFTYVSMGLWVLIQNAESIPSIFSDVFASAFTGHSAVGGFIGSTLISTMSQGVRRGCYTGDIGIGYASVIHSESSVVIPEKQASLVIFEIFLDTFFICTSSVILVLVTGTWKEPLDAIILVQSALGKYFPYMHLFMPIFLFLVGYATINAYFCVGLKCAQFLMPRFGRFLYTSYAAVALVAFAFVDTTHAQSVMAIAGALLLLVNCAGIYRLRKQVSFDYSSEGEKLLVTEGTPAT
jgi:alanine or glycine:cation symporter, AGCS family